MSLIYHWATRNIEDEQQQQKFDARLWMPPKGEVPVQGPWTAEAEMSAFNRLKSQITGSGPAPDDTGDAGTRQRQDLRQETLNRSARQRQRPRARPG